MKLIKTTDEFGRSLLRAIFFDEKEGVVKMLQNKL